MTDFGEGKVVLYDGYGEARLWPALVIRGSQIQTTYADPAVAARSAHSVGVGVSLYLARNIKLVADYDRTQFAGGGASGNRALERFVSTRFQTGF